MIKFLKSPESSQKNRNVSIFIFITFSMCFQKSFFPSPLHVCTSPGEKNNTKQDKVNKCINI